MDTGILIVEDERIAAMALKLFLEGAGYPVAGTAGTGQQAVDMAREIRPDLILMDIHLGEGMDGIAAAEAIQKERPVPVVFLTAYSDEDTLRRAGATAPFSYMVKPIQDRQLRPVIEMALYRHRVEQEREELLASLQRAMAEVERLRAYIPVCAWCRKIRTDDGYYQDLMEYLAETFGTQITHGICDDCARELKKDRG
jgi:CheY-like chemotaxis protein